MADDPTLTDEHINQLFRAAQKGRQRKAPRSQGGRPTKSFKGVRDELDGILKGWEKAKP